MALILRDKKLDLIKVENNLENRNENDVPPAPLTPLTFKVHVIHTRWINGLPHDRFYTINSKNVLEEVYPVCL